MNNLLHIAIESIVRIFPLSESELMMEISSFHPSEHETVPGITLYLEDVGFRVQEIFQNNGLDLFDDEHGDIGEFRHILKTLSARMNQPENSLNRNGIRSYEWIDIFRSNMRSLQKIVPQTKKPNY